jgi:hypothetical protein
VIRAGNRQEYRTMLGFYRAALASLMLLVMPTLGSAQVSVGRSINIAPPVLPVYDRPPIPGDGYLWTPGYWGSDGGAFFWHDGYGGYGFQGGYWHGAHLYYNRSVTNIGHIHIDNVYTKRVTNIVSASRVSFNGGHGGTTAKASRKEIAAARGPDRHTP